MLLPRIILYHSVKGRQLENISYGISAESANVVVAYEYNSDGIRISKTFSEGGLEFIVDSNKIPIQGMILFLQKSKIFYSLFLSRKVRFMRGIEFHGCSYEKLFEEFCLDDYDCYIYEDEIIVEKEQQKINGYISAKELQALFSNPDILIVSMNLQAFPKGAKSKKVCNYSEYMLSQCSFVVLVIDVSWIEIYTKKDEDCLKFIRNAKCCKGRDIKIKTESNDGRYTFLIS